MSPPGVPATDRYPAVSMIHIQVDSSASEV